MTSVGERRVLDLIGKMLAELKGLRADLAGQAAALLEPLPCEHPEDRRQDLTIRRDAPKWKCLECGHVEPPEAEG